MTERGERAEMTPRAVMRRASKRIHQKQLMAPRTAGTYNHAQEELDALQSLEDDGFALVPLEPTEEMGEIGNRKIDNPDGYGAFGIYRAMLASRPK